MSIEGADAILELWDKNRKPFEEKARRALYIKWINDSNFCKLFVTLDQEQRNFLNAYIDRAHEVYLDSIDEAFIIGFKKGMRLALEATIDDEK